MPFVENFLNAEKILKVVGNLYLKKILFNLYSYVFSKSFLLHFFLSFLESGNAMLHSSFSTFANRGNNKECLNLNTSCNFPKEIDDTNEIKHCDTKTARHKGCVEPCMGGFVDSNRKELQIESEIERCKVEKMPIEHKGKLLDGKSKEGSNENKTLGSNRKRKWIEKVLL